MRWRFLILLWSHCSTLFWFELELSVFVSVCVSWKRTEISSNRLPAEKRWRSERSDRRAWLSTRGMPATLWSKPSGWWPSVSTSSTWTGSRAKWASLLFPQLMYFVHTQIRVGWVFYVLSAALLVKLNAWDLIFHLSDGSFNPPERAKVFPPGCKMSSQIKTNQAWLS